MLAYIVIQYITHSSLITIYTYSKQVYGTLQQFKITIYTYSKHITIYTYSREGYNTLQEFKILQKTSFPNFNEYWLHSDPCNNSVE